MTIPGWAPSTPASHDPAWLVTTPLRHSAVDSPKYQTLSSPSCANQSSVSSVSRSPWKPLSRTTTVVTPITVRVVAVTVVTTRSVPCWKVVVVPGTSGKYVLSTTVVKSAGSITGAYGLPSTMPAGLSTLTGPEGPAFGRSQIDAPAMIASVSSGAAISCQWVRSHTLASSIAP